MRKDQREELQRLEQALLETDAGDTACGWEHPEAAGEDWLEEIFQEDPRIDCAVYNTDTADVDLEQYSQEVLEVPKRKGCGCVVFCLLCILAGSAAFWLLKKWGVL